MAAQPAEGNQVTYMVPLILRTVGQFVDGVVQVIGIPLTFLPVAFMGFLEGGIRPNVSGIQGAAESVRELVRDPATRRGAGLLAISYVGLVEPNIHLITRTINALSAAATVFASGIK